MRSNWLYLASRSLRAARADLDLAGAGRDGEVGDGAVLGLAAAMAEITCGSRLRAPSRTASSVSVSVPIWFTLTRMLLADAPLDARLQPFGVGDEEVVADELDAVAERVGERHPAVPVVLGQPSSMRAIG